MSNKNSESVKLLIEAEYLADEQFKEATDNVKKLAKESEKTDKALDQLKIDKATIKSYGELGYEINNLKDDIEQATIAQKEASKEHGKSSSEYKKTTRAVQVLNQDLASLKKTYNAQGTALKKYRVDSKNVEQTVIDLNAKIEKSAEASKKQSLALKEASAELERATVKQRSLATEKKRQLQIEEEIQASLEATSKEIKEEARAWDELDQSIAETTAERKKELDVLEQSHRKTIEEEKALTRTKNALKEYEQKLKQLNKQRREGYLTQGDWIRAEKELANQLKNSGSEIATIKKALEAEEKALDKLNAKLDKAGKISEKYRKELEQLNQEKKERKLSSKQLAEAEEKLGKKYKRSTQEVNQNSKAVSRNAKTLKKAKSSTDALTKTTRRLAQAYTLLLAGGKAIDVIGSSIKQFGAVEAGMTKVEKTTNMARGEVEGLKNELNDMAVNITPTATKELLGYAEVAGQLGVTSKQGILDLVVASDALQSSTNLAGDEAVTLLTRMLMMSGEGVEGIHNLSSAVVELGNTTATTEQDIVHMGKEILTAGASINLSTDQAVAWGATLKEAGQTAERSRTAIQELALMIKKASVEGGEDLLKLSKITGLTSKAIQEGLGEAPEKILLSFVQGLNRIKEEGGIVATTLDDVGIKSLYAQATLGKLGDVSLRLAENMRTASEAYIDQDRHLIEASKAYADQDASIQRVVNKLSELQERLGQTFSDETNATIRNSTKAIEEYEYAINELGHITADTMAGIIEHFERYQDLFDATGAVLGKFSNAIKVVFNLFENGVDAVLLSVEILAYNFAKITFASDAELKYLADSMEATKQRMLKNNQDIADGAKLFIGQTSYAYIGLRDAIKDNDKAVKALSVSKQIEIDQLMKKATWSKVEMERAELLTASIGRQVNVLERAEYSAERANKSKKERAKEAEESAKKEARLKERAIELQDELTESGKSFAVYQKELTDSIDKGTISIVLYKDKLKVVNKVLEIQSAETKKLTDEKTALENIERKSLKTVASFVDLRQDETEASTKLVSSIKENEAEVRRLEIAQVGLNKKSEKYIALQVEINELKTETIVDLKELNKLRELEDMTQTQLLAVQEDHIKKLKLLKDMRDADVITIQVYNEEVAKLATTTNFLSDNLETVTDKTKDNTAANKLAQEQDAIRALTLDELITLQQQHINLLTDLEYQHTSGAISTEEYNKKMAELAVTTEFLAENYEKLIEQKEREAKASADEAIKNEYEAKTIKELMAIKVDHDKVLASLLSQYKNGEITWAKYQLELGKMKIVTDILSQALANNTDEVAKNIDQLDEQAEAMSRNEKIAEKFAKRSEQRAQRQATMLTASESVFDATTASASELADEIETLEGRIYQNSKVMRGSWFHGLASSQVALDEASLATARQAKEVLELQQRYESLENPTLKATKAISRSIDSMGDLDDATLNSLRDEVDDTISAFDDLRESINDSLDSVEDRLSKLRGEEEQAIQARKHQRELEEAEALKEQATGDDEAVAKAEALIRKLKKAHKIERDNLKREIAKDKAEAEQDAKDDAEYNKVKTTKRTVASDSVASTPSTSNAQPIIINLGSKRTELTANKDDIMELLTDMGYTIS